MLFSMPFNCVFCSTHPLGLSCVIQFRVNYGHPVLYLKIGNHNYFKVGNVNNAYFLSELYRPSSTVYQEISVGDGLADKLTPTLWDASKPSQKSKEVRPYDRHSGPRGYRAVRDVGKYKVDEGKFQKL